MDKKVPVPALRIQAITGLIVCRPKRIPSPTLEITTILESTRYAATDKKRPSVYFTLQDPFRVTCRKTPNLIHTNFQKNYLLCLTGEGRSERLPCYVNE